MFLKTCIAVLVLAAMLPACGRFGGETAGKGRPVVTIAGSTSVMPFTEKLAEHFMVDHPNFTIDVQGGGSTAGIQAIRNNTVNIGMSSRPLKEAERTLNTITICYDGIAIVVHPSNPVSAITVAKAADIFSGRMRNWKDFGWIDRKIDAVTREEGSGTRGAFEDLVMRGGEIDDAIMVQDSNGSVKEIVATDPYAIGYISMGLVDERVKALTVDGVAPGIRTVKVGRYRIVRPFIFVTNGELADYPRAFVDFVLSKNGQEILRKEGLVGFYD